MRRFAVVALACALALGACAPSAAVGPVAVYDPRGRHYEDTILEGRIRIADGCMTVPWRGRDVVLMFPADDVTWDEDAGLLTYRGRSYGDGDVIELGIIVHFGRTSGSVPEACPPSVRIYVVDEDAD